MMDRLPNFLADRTRAFNYRDWPVNRKLSSIVLFSAGLIIILMMSFVSIEKYLSFRNNLKENLTAVANIIGRNSTAALIFDDKENGEEILSALQEEDNIIAACLLDKNDSLFAVYQNPAYYTLDHHKQLQVCPIEKPVQQSGQDTFASFTFNDLILQHTVLLNQNTIGDVLILSDMSSVNEQIQIFIVILGCISGTLFVVAHLICGFLNRLLMRPVNELVTTMQKVSSDNDYSARVRKFQNDEFGILVDGFNDMLDQIDRRDQELDHHRNRLIELVEERTEELRESNTKLLEEMEERKATQEKLAHAQKMEAIGTLAGGVAHDLNNYLSGVVSYPDLLLANLPEGSPMQKPLETIKSSGDKAAAIVQDLLTLARRGVKIKKETELNELVRSYILGSDCTTLLSNYENVTIDSTFSETPAYIKGSPLHIENMLMNLITNAAEAMPNGGEIQLRCQTVFLENEIPGYTSWRKGTYFELVIIDSGVGISKENLHRIFEPFFSKKVMGRSGTGLGMAVVWGTVEDHNGHILIESEEGKGTTLRVLLPVVEHMKVRDDTLEENTVEHGRGEKILVVDDSEDQRIIATELLKHLGYQVDAVTCGEDAIEFLQKNDADLVVLDMIMDPGIDGLETYKRIHQNNPNQKVIIASGFSSMSRMNKARDIGVLDLIMKPYGLNSFGKVIHQALHSKKSNTELG